jgi:hypothetical protein
VILVRIDPKIRGWANYRRHVAGKTQIVKEPSVFNSLRVSELEREVIHPEGLQGSSEAIQKRRLYPGEKHGSESTFPDAVELGLEGHLIEGHQQGGLAGFRGTHQLVKFRLHNWLHNWCRTGAFCPE